MTATAKLDLLDKFSECPVSKVERSLEQKIATDGFGSVAADRFRTTNGRSRSGC
jgi:hypothetical protein